MNELQKEFIKHLAVGLANTYQSGIDYIITLHFEIKQDEIHLQSAKEHGARQAWAQEIENKKNWIAETHEGLLARSKEVKNIINDLEKLFQDL